MTGRNAALTAAVITTGCIVVHAAAVAFVAPESPTNDSVLRLGYNPEGFGVHGPTMLGFIVALMLIAREPIMQAGCVLIVGGALSQILTFLAWGKSPDYVLVNGYIWNVSDFALLLGMVVTMVGALRVMQLAARSRRVV